MSYYTGRVTLSQTGDNVIDEIGFQPTWIRVRVSQKVGIAETCQHLCLGQSDGTRTNYSTIYGDTSGAKTIEGNDKLISHFEKVSGTWTEVLSATLVSFDADGVTIHTTAGNANYRVHLELGD